MPKNERAETSDDIADTRAWFVQTVRTDGLRIAYEALTGVCKDPKAPAPAKATAGVALLRAAGVFDAPEDDSDVSPAEMAPEQLNRAIAKARRRFEDM
jgi:hypothetical protein